MIHTLSDTVSTNGTVFARRGAAQVSYLPGHHPVEAEVEFVVAGWRTACTAEQAVDLVQALTAALNDPMATAQRIARRAAALAGGGEPR